MSIWEVYSRNKAESIADILAVYQVFVATLWLEALWTISGVVVMPCCCQSGESNTTSAYTLIDRSVPQVDVSLLVMQLTTTLTLSTAILFRLLTFLAVVTASLLMLLSFLSVRLNWGLRRFKSLRLSCCSSDTYGCIWNCAHGRLFYLGDERVAACSIARAKRMSLDACWHNWNTKKYCGADKSLARPGRKETRKHVRDARDFNNIETRAVIKFFFFFSCEARRRRKFTPFWEKH